MAGTYDVDINKIGMLISNIDITIFYQLSRPATFVVQLLVYAYGGPDFES